jgi:predicted acylesterase/phospholipase RssA
MIGNVDAIVSSMSHAGRTALVLAGGGVSGAVYEIGALRAIDDLLVNRTVNDFDIYVGTSAGALVAGFLANGVSSADLMRVVSASHPLARFPESKHLFHFNSRETLRRSMGLPRRLFKTTLKTVARRGRMSVLDMLFTGLGDALPSGIYDISPYRDWMQQTIHTIGCSDCFDELEKELFIVATQLDNGQRTVFSRQTPEVGIADAVAASSAVPVIYKPVRIGEKEFIDGGTRGNASLDLAIEHGAKLVVCINSLVPIESNNNGASRGLISDRGLEAVSAQATRVLLHAGLKYQIKQLQRRHPDVDIILIEPKPDDANMFFANIMDLKDRVRVAEHGFRSVSVDLADQYAQFKATLARYGIDMSTDRVMAELQVIRESRHDTLVVRRVLEHSGLEPVSQRNGRWKRIRP